MGQGDEGGLRVAIQEELARFRERLSRALKRHPSRGPPMPRDQRQALRPPDGCRAGGHPSYLGQVIDVKAGQVVA